MFTHNISGLCKKYDVIPDVIFGQFTKSCMFRRSKLLSQFSQIIKVVAIATIRKPFLYRLHSQSKNQPAIPGTKKAGKPKLINQPPKENMAIIGKGITRALPGVLPCKVRKWVASPHATHFLRYFKRHTNSGVRKLLSQQ